MRKLISQMMISVDGFFEGPSHEIDWHIVDPDTNTTAIDLLNHAGGLLFGRVTYELMAGFWPTPIAASKDPIVAGRMNQLPKIVFSRTLSTVTWGNTRLVRENAAGEVLKLKQQPGEDLVILGSSGLMLTLIEHDLIDEFRIIVNPVALGNGNSLFKGLKGRLNLNLAKVHAFDSGNVLLSYLPKRIFPNARIKD